MIIGSRKWDVPILIAGLIGGVTMSHFWYSTGVVWWIRFPADAIWGAFIGWNATSPVKRG